MIMEVKDRFGKAADVFQRMLRKPSSCIKSRSLVVLQPFFQSLRLKTRLNQCFAHADKGKVFARSVLSPRLMSHPLLGYRELRESHAYQNDPLAQRLLGLKRPPDAATLSRMLKEADPRSVANVRRRPIPLYRGKLDLLAPETSH